MSSVSTDSRRFAAQFGVSRETMEKLDLYAHLLRKWTPTINLIAPSTVTTIWSRHFTDSAQILAISDFRSGHWVDIGSGGGLPGLVLAILCEESRPEISFTLVESDVRKAVFLRTVVREISLDVSVCSQRVESLKPLSADVISARAVAPLSDLLGYAELHLKAKGKAVFLKGARFQNEIDEALEVWSFEAQKYQSITDENAAVLCLGEIERV